MCFRTASVAAGGGRYPLEGTAFRDALLGAPLLDGGREPSARALCGQGIAAAGLHNDAAWAVGLNQRSHEGFGFHHGRLPERGPPYLVAATIGVRMARILPDPRPTAGLADPVRLN